MHRSTSIAAAILAGSLALTACGGGSGSEGGDRSSGSSSTEAPSGARGGAHDVEIRDFAFDPDATEVEVGDTVTFTNGDSATHTATAEDGDPEAFDTGKLDSGTSKQITFDEAGEYDYYCSIHEYMKGTIRVVG